MYIQYCDYIYIYTFGYFLSTMISEMQQHKPGMKSGQDSPSEESRSSPPKKSGLNHRDGPTGDDRMTRRCDLAL